MRPRLVPVALLLCAVSTIGPRQAAAQAVALRYYVVAHAMPECPMPVVVPDLATSERMPVARINPAPYAIRLVPIGCVNPLGPNPDSIPRRAPPIP